MFRMPLHEEGISLQEWANTHEPGDEMLWKSAYWSQINFVGVELHRLFVLTYGGVNKYPVMVVGTHTSKSIELPVYSIRIPGFEIRMRDNFYDWVVSIRSMSPVPDVFLDIIKKDWKLPRFYFQGFQDDWVFGSYNENPCQFSVEIESKHDLYAFILAITHATRQ